MLIGLLLALFVGGVGCTQEVRCSDCKGMGEIRCGSCNGTGEVDCTICGGTGQKRCTNCTVLLDGWRLKVFRDNCTKCNNLRVLPCPTDQDCWECHGAGYKTCYTCDGTGVVKK